MESEVAVAKVKYVKNGVQDAVKKAMTLANWTKHVNIKKDGKLFLKINGISDHLVPGQVTSPWVLEGVLQEIRRVYPNCQLSIGDANLAAYSQLHEAATLWGFKDLCAKYNARFVNLSEDELLPVKIPNGKIVKDLELPRTLVDADAIITMPVAKTHFLTQITCSIKNQWGCIPVFRHQFHVVADKMLADINSYLKKIKFVVCDMTVCMEGNAPRTGIPKICDMVIASHDRVAVDSAVATYMGLDPKKIGSIMECEDSGVGTSNFKLIGEEMGVNLFKPPRGDRQPIYIIEMTLRKIPIIKNLVFDTPLFYLGAAGATWYNKVWWYNLKGKKYAKDILENTWYGKEEFAPLLKISRAQNRQMHSSY